MTGQGTEENTLLSRAHGAWPLLPLFLSPESMRKVGIKQTATNVLLGMTSEISHRQETVTRYRIEWLIRTRINTLLAHAMTLD